VAVAVNGVLRTGRELGLALIAGVAYGYFYQCVLYDGPLRQWLLPFLSGLYFGVICYAIFFVSVRLGRSPLLFCVLSWLAVAVLSALNVIGASRRSTSMRWNGFDIFIHGDITPFGVLFEIFDPILVLAAWATWRLATGNKPTPSDTNHRSDSDNTTTSN
jgi:hypothetical protein